MRNGARPKVNRQKTHNSYSSKPNENKAHDLHEQIKEFEEFKANILPALQKDLNKGMKPKELREKYAALVQARLITDALVTQDASKAAAVGKDLLDRVEGKATEKKEVTHKFTDMKDEELDAILQSEIQELEDMESRFDS